jgi:cation:H+ antiporter
MENFINNAPFALVLVCLVIGFVLLIKGADFFVEGSSSAAKRLHVPSIIIGLTIVAMGTSLPETAVSVSASLTGNNELAVSNVIGSNIFNVFFVLGISAVIRPLPSYSNLWIDASLAALGSLLLLLFVSTNRHKELKRWQGAFFLACYGVYLVWLLTSL